MVESSEIPLQLGRESVPDILRVVAHGADDDGSSWNAVESIELLLDAGAFRDARTLAQGVVEMLGDDRRNRLFKMYGALCALLDGEPLHQALDCLQRLSIEIEHGGFSYEDRCWSAITLARALSVAISSKAVPEVEQINVRSRLSRQFEEEVEGGPRPCTLRVGLELARVYLHAPCPDKLVARDLLERISEMARALPQSAELQLDLSRLLYQVGAISADILLERAQNAGEVGIGLAQLSIVRMDSTLSSQQASSLEATAKHFQKVAYRSGEFEILVTLAGSASDSGHHVKALRLYSQAESIAREGGFLYGRGVALLGMFHAAVGCTNKKRAEEVGSSLRRLCGKELFLTAFGLNTVAALQLLGNLRAATTLAQRCEKVFSGLGDHEQTGRAAFMLGASYAETGKWKLARSSWRRALTCDELRRTYISACDRRAALAQAVAMVDFTENGSLSDKTWREVTGLFEASARCLEPFGTAPAAREALGKTLHVHAQLAVVARRPLDALKYLHRARECYGEQGLEREVALTDALTGLALLEVSKIKGGGLLEEASMALQRALDFFAGDGHARITWKLRYYLAVACVMRSEASGLGEQREIFRQMALELLDEALEESASEAPEAGMARALSGEGDFSPGLQPDVIDPLRRALGGKLRGAAPEKSEKTTIEAPKRYGRYLH